MSSFSIWHWLVVLILLAVFFWPLWKIVGRTGHPAILSILFLIPLANILFVWFLALSKWPALERRVPAGPGQV